MKEKDWDYIAKVEQAIAEKYGKEAIQNPAKFWNEEKEKEYLEQLKEMEDQCVPCEDKVEQEGFFITKKLVNRDTKRTCSVCGKYSFWRQDDVYMIKHSCCYKCYIKDIEYKELLEEQEKKRLESETNEN
tara:strand:- start:70 stop:459 length:390 start_codon:yes stop_codon:yes gene_type:complete